MMNQMKSQRSETQLCVAFFVLSIACAVAPRAMAEDDVHADHSDHGAAPASAHAGHSGPAAHAPIGVMGDHPHAKGETMLSYRYMRMEMKGMREGDESISRGKVLQDFMVTPTSMDMEMHMFGLMYAPIERVTLSLMVPLVRLEMDHQTGTGRTFTTRSDGIGDISASALIELWRNDEHEVHANLGPWFWGGQARGKIRLNDNHATYRFGDEYALTAWGAFELTKWVSMSLRTEWTHNMNIRGREGNGRLDPNAPPTVPTKDPGRQARMRLDLLAGVNFLIPGGPMSGIRLALEGGLPVYEYLDGPALETDWLMTAGLQYTF